MAAKLGRYVRKQRRNKYVKINSYCERNSNCLLIEVQRPEGLSLNVNKPLLSLNSNLPLLEGVTLNVNEIEIVS